MWREQEDKCQRGWNPKCLKNLVYIGDDTMNDLTISEQAFGRMMANSSTERGPDRDKHGQRRANMEKGERKLRVVAKQQRQISEARRRSDSLINYRPQNTMQRNEPSLHVLVPIHSLQLNP